MEHAWIETYGPWAVLIGGILEGETVFVAAGYAISQGYLDPVSTFLLAVAGGSLGDAGWYLLGRWKGLALLQSVPVLRKVRIRATRLLRRWGRTTAFLMRFAYGLRIVLPVSVGVARFPWPLFISFNLLGSMTFASVYLLLGYFFGEIIEELLQTVRGAEPWILFAILVLGGVIWALREWSLFHAAQAAEEQDEV